MSWAYTHRETVRFGDLDAMRHLNNVVFLRYFETARINFFTALVGTKSLKLDFEMAVEDRLIAEGHGVLVGYDYAQERTIPIPDALRAKLAIPD